MPLSGAPLHLAPPSPPLAANRQGPTYVCLDLKTFVCDTCSGLLREGTFGFAVKSMSHSTFTPQDVEELKKGGNRVAKKKWLARWKEKSFPLPTSGDVPRIREYMRLKYKDRKWMKKAGKKKKKKRQVESSEEEESDLSDDSVSTSEDEAKRRRKKKKKKKARRRTSSLSPAPSRDQKRPARERAATTGAAPPAVASSGGVTNLFGDLTIEEDGPAAPAPSTAVASDWDAFGESTPKPAATKPTAAKPAGTKTAHSSCIRLCPPSALRAESKIARTRSYAYGRTTRKGNCCAYEREAARTGRLLMSDVQLLLVVVFAAESWILYYEYRYCTVHYNYFFASRR